MVNVEIDDGDALGAVLGARVEAGDGGIGEQAEAHGAVALGVVTRTGAPGRTRCAALPAMTASTAARPAPTARSAASQVPAETTVSPSMWRGCASGPLATARIFSKVRLRVRETDLLLDVLAQRRLLAQQVLEDVVRQHLVDGAHAVGPLGVTGAGVVLGEGRVREKERRHGCACRVLLLRCVRTPC